MHESCFSFNSPEHCADGIRIRRKIYTGGELLWNFSNTRDAMSILSPTASAADKVHMRFQYFYSDDNITYTVYVL